MRTTIEPVTLGGWYEHTDGTVGQYLWIDGQCRLSRTVTSWEAVGHAKAADLAGEADYQRWLAAERARTVAS